MKPANMMTETKGRAEAAAGSEKTVDLSVVVPISERHDNLRELYVQYARELSTGSGSFEFIFILDGAHPEALQTLRQLKKEFPQIKVVALNRRFGEATALSVGFDQARGQVIMTLSSYFQVEPPELPRIFKIFEDGESDLIITRRYPRIDSVFNRVQSWVFHRLIRMLTGIMYLDISCGLRVMRRKVAEEIHLYGDLHRFFPLFAFQQGFKIREVSVRQSVHDTPRRVHRPGLYLRRLLDILTLFFLFKFTKKPLRFFGLIGSSLLGTGALITGYLGLYRLLGFGGIADRPLLILGVLAMVLGVQLFSIGLLGEIIIFTHARDIKEYQVDEILE